MILKINSSKFNLDSEFKESYNSICDIGKGYAKEKTVCITGLARNVESVINSNLNILDSLKENFKKQYLVVYENDSTDDTPNIIRKWMGNRPDCYLISENLGSEHPRGPSSKSKIRTEAMSRYRNSSKSYIKDNLQDIDYIIVVDLDFQGLSIAGIINSFGWIKKDNIDIMAGHSYLPYKINEDKTLETSNYDSWAFRQNWWEDRQHLMSWFLFWHPTVGSPPMRVNSAFGGMCIYNSSMYLNTDYEGYDCEHVCFHKNIYLKYPNCNLFVNPSQFMITS